MRDLKTYLSVAPLMVWVFSRSIDRDQSFISGCADIPFFFILVSNMGSGEED